MGQLVSESLTGHARVKKIHSLRASSMPYKKTLAAKLEDQSLITTNVVEEERQFQHVVL